MVIEERDGSSLRGWIGEVMDISGSDFLIHFEGYTHGHSDYCQDGAGCDWWFLARQLTYPYQWINQPKEQI